MRISAARYFESMPVVEGDYFDRPLFRHTVVKTRIIPKYRNLRRNR